MGHIAVWYGVVVCGACECGACALVLDAMGVSSATIGCVLIVFR
jgi:hypothetical protein